jgi:hypothetical protein
MDKLVQLLYRPADCSFKGDWPGARVGQIEGGPPNQLQGANPTENNVVSYTKWKMIISATTLPALEKMR